MNDQTTSEDAVREALWVGILRDETLLAALETLRGAAILDAFFQLFILTRVRQLVESGTPLQEIVAVADRARRVTELAKTRWRTYLEQFDNATKVGRDSIYGALVIAGAEYRQALENQPPNVYLDVRKIGSKGPGLNDDKKAMNGWAVKLIAERLPDNLGSKSAIVARLLRVAGFDISRQHANSILRGTK